MTTKLTPEQAKEIKTINELREAVKSEKDYIGLMGHQPSLRKIRSAYKSNEITDQELEIVLKALYDKTGGEAEPFKSAKHFYHECFAGIKVQKQEKPELSVADQAMLIKEIIGEKKKAKKRAAKPKPAVTIDPSLLPPELQGFLK